MESIIEKLDVSDKSKKVYLSLIRRLDKDKFKWPMKGPQKEKYITEFLENYPKYSTKLDMLNIIIVLRSASDLNTDKLKDIRKTFQKNRINNNIETMQDKKKDLITLEVFNEELDKAFSQGKWGTFIINFLWVNYGTRNKDMDIEIVKSKKAMKEHPEDNYLHIGKTSVTWYRNTYKTVASYGKKSHIITDERFMNAVNKEGLGKILSAGQIGNALRKHQIAGMSEADVFKMLIDSSYVKQDTENINKLSQSRGTNIETILNFYNINKKQDIIREI
tara:strand:- start:1511 stop:2338 length:828 start_codon:yes stop_codon:yes gene_type:complete